MDSYQTVLSVRVSHGFYTSGICSCLDFRPTKKTARLLHGTGMRLIKTADGIQLIQHLSALEALKSYADDAQEKLSLDFKVYAADEYFRSFTEPYSEDNDQVLYFDSSHVTEPGDVKLTRSKYASDQDLINISHAILSEVLEPGDRMVPPVFVLRFFINDISGLLAERHGKSSPPGYLIAFRPRQRYWKYYLLGNRANEDLYVVDKNCQIEFEALGQITLFDQRKAYAFRSKQAIPMNDHYKYRFQLKEKMAGANSVVMSPLPVASISRIGKDVIANKETIVSEIYVNVT